MLAVPDTAAVRGWESFRSTTHFGSLDGLRCLSIVAVIWHHGPGLHLQGLGGRGYMGVILFFGISGFLITTLLLREHDRNSVISLPKFYIRRALRIFPLYFAVLGVYCLLVYAMARHTEAGQKFFANLPYFLTYTSNWFVGGSGTFAFAWSLAAEEQFYSTWPFAIRYLRPFRSVWLIAALTAVVVALHIFPIRGNGNFGLTILQNVPMAICWGCLAAFLLHSRFGFTLLWKGIGYRWTSAALLLSVAVVLSTPADHPVTAHFLLVALVASCVIREDHILAPLLKWRWMTSIGSVSYGIYLLHGLVYDSLTWIGYWICSSWEMHNTVGFLLALIITFGIAILSFRYYETPFLRLKSRFKI